MCDDKIIKKIIKLMALAGSDNEHEAATAKRQAEFLMNKHGLSWEQMAHGAIDEHQINAKAYRIPRWKLILAQECAELFSAKTYFRNGTNVRLFKEDGAITFVGHGKNPVLASYLYDILARQLTSARQAYAKQLGKAKNKRLLTRDFAEFWIGAAIEKAEKVFKMDEDKLAAVQTHLDNNKKLVKADKSKCQKTGRGAMNARLSDSRQRCGYQCACE